jgi:curved DNA-binding protein CbpA
MDARSFVDYYGILELGPGASPAAIAHRFRHLARRYHPDNQATGDRCKFDAVVEAHDILKDAARRARYHDDHPHHLPPLWPSVDDEDGEAGSDSAPDADVMEAFIDGHGIDRDISIQNNLLTLLYLRRRRNIREPGMGDAELEQLTGCPPEHLEFHLWYLKAKGWIATGEDGLLAITIDGVDRAARLYQDGARLLTDRS